MQWYDIHYLLDGVYFYSNPYGYISILEDNHVFFNTYDPYSIKNFGRVPVEFFDDLVHSEEYIMVLEVIFIFFKTYELSNSIKPLLYHYYNNEGGVAEDVSLLHIKETTNVVSGVKRNGYPNDQTAIKFTHFQLLISYVV